MSSSGGHGGAAAAVPNGGFGGGGGGGFGAGPRRNGGMRPGMTMVGPGDDDDDMMWGAEEEEVPVMVDHVQPAHAPIPWRKEMLKERLYEDDGQMYFGPESGFLGKCMLLFTVVLIFLTVLVCNVLSKFSFLALVKEMNDARSIGAEDEALTSRGSQAMVMLAIIVSLPAVVTFLYCVWRSCYAAVGNNPWPCDGSWKFNLLQAALEAVGLCTFVFCIATRIDAPMILAIMPAIFPVLGFNRMRTAYKKRLGDDHAGEYVPEDEEEELLEPLQGHRLPPRAPRKQRVTKMEVRVYFVAATLQALGVFATPVFLFLTGSSISLAILTAVSCLCLSFAWLPRLHEKIQETTAEFKLRYEQSRGSYMPPVPPTARVIAYMVNSLLRLLFISLYLVAYSHIDPDFKFTSVGKALEAIRSSPLLTPFLVQLFASLVGYHVARLACLLTLHRSGYALPLFLASPISLIVFFTYQGFPLFALPNDNVRDLWAVIFFNAVYWLSELCLLWRTAWNSRTPRLALDEVLFIQPTYNPILLEQFSLVNRREPRELQSRVVIQDLRSPEEELKRSVIFMCTTMYREDEEEMRQVVKSLIGLAPRLGNVVEAHVFMDGGANGDVLQQFALQLVHILHEEVERAYPHESAKNGDYPGFPSSGKRICTPYGIRLEWILPDRMTRMPFVVHLKDGGKVKNKKRWSQILYMYYFLQFRFPADRSDRKGYILATDADVRFETEDVIALHTLLSRDQRVGAVCGRTYPIGPGPLAWYQMFDYAIGHWFQKAAEHVLGSVLCCPGCFTLYRLDALRSTLLTYGTGVDKAFDFLIKDMGEDRWLCTLLVQEGWRLDYTATASDYTHCPITFKEFFNQRRRWIMSTLANIISLLQNWEKATRNNNSISFFFILYQALMLFSTVISPATVLLVIIGGLYVSLEVSVAITSSLLVACTILFIMICMCGVSQDNQILAAQIFTLIFAFIMGAVVIGEASEISREFSDPDANNTLPGPTTPAPWTPWPTPTTHNKTMEDMIYSTVGASARHLLDTHIPESAIFPHTGISISTVYLGAIIAMFLIAGVLHLPEFLCLVHGIWYILCLPGGYLFLIIYSFCNLNDRSWGTREEAQKKAQASASGWDELLYGCGRHSKESLIRFFGRLMCCRCNVQPQREEVINPYSAIAGPEKKEEAGLWRIVYEHDHLRAVCKPVEDLVTMLRGLNAPATDREMQALTKALAAAVRPCPDIAANATMSRYWDSAKKELRAPTGVNLNDLPFKDNLLHEIGVAYGNRLWDISQPATYRDDLSKPLDVFLDGLRITSLHVRNTLREHGYDDDTFFLGISEADLRAMGFHELIDGTFIIRRLLLSSTSDKLKLQRPVVPALIPTSLQEWLLYLHLECYANNFRAMGYGQEDLVLLETMTDTEIANMGITKRAHVRKLKEGIKKLNQLLTQGRQPEGPSRDTIERLRTRELVQQMELVNFEGSLLAPRHVRNHEDAFFEQLVKELLDCKLDPIENVANLKADLENLRNTAVLSLIVINALWMVLMLLMLQASASSLTVWNTNVLGLSFLLLFGFLFTLQFLSMLWHRFSALIEWLAGLELPSFELPSFELGRRPLLAEGGGV